MARTRTVETVQAPPPVDLSYIPADVVSYYGGLNLATSLASNNDQVIAQASINSRYPALWEEIPEDFRNDFRGQLTKHGFRVDTATGLIKKGDCILYTQPIDARSAQLAEGTDTWLRMDSPQAPDQFVEELTRSHGLIPELGHIFVKSGGPLSGHSVSGRGLG